MSLIEKINTFKNILILYARIKTKIIVKKYNDLSLPMSIQSEISIFMEAFPLKAFWDFVIMINIWVNPHEETFLDYFEEKDETYLDIF